MHAILLLAVLCLAASGRADVAPLNPSRGKCRAECQAAIRSGCVFPHPGLRRGAIRRCVGVCLHGGDRSTICTPRQVPPPLGDPFGALPAGTPTHGGHPTEDTARRATS